MDLDVVVSRVEGFGNRHSVGVRDDAPWITIHGPSLAHHVRIELVLGAEKPPLCLSRVQEEGCRGSRGSVGQWPNCGQPPQQHLGTDCQQLHEWERGKAIADVEFSCCSVTSSTVGDNVPCSG